MKTAEALFLEGDALGVFGETGKATNGVICDFIRAIQDDARPQWLPIIHHGVSGQEGIWITGVLGVDFCIDNPSDPKFYYQVSPRKDAP